MLILGVGVNRHSTWKGSAETLEGLFLTMLILGGSIDTQLGRICRDLGRIASGNVDPGGVDRHSTWKGSAETLEGLPLRMLILGCQSTLNLERICRDLGRIASDNVDPGGVNRPSTWKGSAETLEGLPLTMLILGGLINTQLGKDLQRPWKDCL